MATNGLGAAESCVAEVGERASSQGAGAAHDQILPFVTGCSSSGGPGMVACSCAGLEPSMRDSEYSRENARAPPRHSSAALSAQDAMAVAGPKMVARPARCLLVLGRFPPSLGLPGCHRLWTPWGTRKKACPHRGAMGTELSFASSTSG